MKRLLWITFLIFIMGVSFAHAQNPVITRPYGVTGSNSSSAITSTNAFQSIWAASTAITGRTDCIIQNLGSSSMFIFFGAVADATTPNSLTLSSGSIFRCNNGGVVTKDQITITGTAGQRFLAIQY